MINVSWIKSIKMNVWILFHEKDRNTLICEYFFTSKDSNSQTNWIIIILKLNLFKLKNQSKYSAKTNDKTKPYRKYLKMTSTRYSWNNAMEGLSLIRKKLPSENSTKSFRDLTIAARSLKESKKKSILNDLNFKFD